MSGSWHSLLVRIGERCAEYGGQADAEDHIETCFNSLLRDLHHHENEILALLVQCAEELPHKNPLYGTLVGLINLENTDFAGKVVTQVHDNLQAALDSGNCNKIRILARFLTTLMCSNVVAGGSLIEVFETLVSSAATTIDEDGGNPAWQPRADFYVFCILASLPWGGLELAERVPEDLERVLAGVEAYLTLRKRNAAPALAVFNNPEGGTESTGEQEDFLEDLWSKIQTLMESGWRVDSVPRPHLAFESRLVTGPSHEFGQLTCPEAPKLPPNATDVVLGKKREEAEKLYPRRVGRLRIFPPAKTDETMAPVDRFVVEEYLLDVLSFLNGCRKECAAYMVGLPVPFRYEYLMAETVFSQLLLLPYPPFKLIYYTVVMVDLCKALPGAFPAVVAGAVRSLFARVADMDVECRTRLVQWLSHHLSNFQFVWPWEEWAHVLEQPKWSPQRVFAQEVLEKEVRLAYWEKVKESLQNCPKLIELLPPKNNTPAYKYEDRQAVSAEEHKFASEVLQMVRSKKTAREIQVYMEEKILPDYGQKMAIEISVHTFLYIGSKSFTHTVGMLEKYGTVLSKLAGNNHSLQTVMVDAVASFWNYSAQMTAIVIDRMMGYRIVSNLAIVAWVFVPENVNRFHTSHHVWEVLENAINKTNNRTSDLKKDIATAQKAVDAVSAAVARADSKVEAALALVELAANDDAKARAKSKLEWATLAQKKTKAEENTAQESLEVKEALLQRALSEQEALFMAVYQNFATVLTERLSKPLPSTGGENEETKAEPAEDPMAVDQENTTEADGADKAETNGERRNQKYGSKTINGVLTAEELEAQEEQVWRKTALGYLRAISRHYATEVWQVIEKLDAEVFVDSVEPRVKETVYSGLRRSL
ncbi:hypothetical protein R1sor_019491 [Riccia sorocarpa]|uniref:Nuclear cap-binding protein subunit 1 n=1 Tax=Riccia sorocarpa TaxID=122646 RepID=A0ABD3IEE4_9MARC